MAQGARSHRGARQLLVLVSAVIASAAGIAACTLGFDRFAPQGAVDASADSKASDGGTDGGAGSDGGGADGCGTVAECVVEAGACGAACGQVSQQCLMQCPNMQCRNGCLKMEQSCRNGCASACAACVPQGCLAAACVDAALGP
jgi:hypothetical protein